MIGRGISVAVIGQGAQAMAVVEALGKVRGVSQARQVSDWNDETKADVMVEMVGGVEPAFRITMDALSSGCACIVTSAMLVAAHGRVLMAAESGQHGFLGLSAVGLAVDFAELLAGHSIKAVTMAFAESANQSLVRMAYRNESLQQIENHFTGQNMDMSDNAGKVTQGRAMALLGSGCGWWPSLVTQTRSGLDHVEPSLFHDVQPFGLEIVFAARAEGEHLYTGPMLVAEGHPLAQAPGHEVMVIETEAGEIVLSQPADETARIVRGVVGDVQRYLRHRSRKLMKAELAQAAQAMTRCMIITSYAQRETVLAQAEDVVMERIPGDGRWQAVVTTKDFRALRHSLPEALLIPLAGEWNAPQQAGLRLVG